MKNNLLPSSVIHLNGNLLITSLALVILLMVSIGCSSDKNSQEQKTNDSVNEIDKGTFGYDVQFLKEYTDVVVLKGKDSPGSVLVTPKMQGRVMTSSVEGNSGKSLGWVNHELIASGEIKEHFTPYGGEDRFWIGPEGGQYSFFITPGEEMTFNNWYVPAGFNTEPWELVAKSDTHVTVGKELSLTNYSNAVFELEVARSIKMFDRNRTEQLLDIRIPQNINQVAYESENSIKNTGEEAWTKETGAPAIWILSMFTPAPGITVVIPFKRGPEEELGPVATTDFFGEIGSERLKIEEGVIYFKVDGKKRRKLGLSPLRALPVAASYDETNNILTIVQYSFSQNNTDYVNQLWEHQSNPYQGEVVFAYNDGPLEDGDQLGPFYELESSSPAAFLDSNESLTHHHRVFHFTGDKQALDQISERVLGVDINDITSAF